MSSSSSTGRPALKRGVRKRRCTWCGELIEHDERVVLRHDAADKLHYFHEIGWVRQLKWLANRLQNDIPHCRVKP